LKEVAKKVVAFILLALIAVTLFSALKMRASASGISTSAKSMIVLERTSGRVLNEKNADLRLPMASTTKIATAITVIENVNDLEQTVVIPSEAQGVEGSSIYLQEGEKLKIIDLLYGLMLQSGNDCAVALALTVGGSIENFATLMNETAKKTGATNTNFITPHGLHDDNHYTTARDLAKITAYAMNNETFRKIVSTKRYITSCDGREYDRVIVNKNKLLSTLDGADGVKTGYTKKAGRCLVASATRNDMSVIAVVLNCGPMFEDCKRLIEDAFSNYKMVNPYSLVKEKITAKVIGGKESEIELSSQLRERYPLSKEEIETIKYEVEIVENLKAPVKIGTENGKIKFYSENKLLFEQKLFTIKDVEPLSIFDKLGNLVEGWFD
jgi:D-alanyl-D-alanine carboxypeptidase (penicillin-binding protein 5/6)